MTNLIEDDEPKDTFKTEISLRTIAAMKITNVHVHHVLNKHWFVYRVLANGASELTPHYKIVKRGSQYVAIHMGTQLRAHAHQSFANVLKYCADRFTGTIPAKVRRKPK